MPAWWDGRDLRALLPKVFFEHFRGTSLVVEHEDRLVGFLVGFLCPDHADEAYIHFVGVRPGLAPRRARRATSTAASSRLARADGRSRRARRDRAGQHGLDRLPHGARASPLLPGDDEVDGVPVTTDRGPHGDHLVRFQLFLGPEAGA